jgi:hypothetical protein
MKFHFIVQRILLISIGIQKHDIILNQCAYIELKYKNEHKAINTIHSKMICIIDSRKETKHIEAQFLPSVSYNKTQTSPKPFPLP